MKLSSCYSGFLTGAPGPWRMENAIREYDWGSTGALAAWQGREPSGRPEAEMLLPVTEFAALAGLRPRDRLIQMLTSLNVPALRPVLLTLARQPSDPPGPQVLLYLNGEGTVSSDGGEVSLRGGQSAFLSASASPTVLTGRGQLYRATVGSDASLTARMARMGPAHAA